MADSRDSITRFAIRLGRILGQSDSLFENFTTEPLGTQLPPSVLDSSAVAGALGSVRNAARGMAEIGVDLESASESELSQTFVRYGEALGRYVQALTQLVGSIEDGITPAALPDPAARAAATALVADLPKRLLDLAIATVIVDRTPSLGLALKLLGLLRWETVQADPADPLGRNHVALSLQFHRLGDLFSDTGRHFQETLGWGGAEFDPTSFFKIYRGFFSEEDSIRIGELDGDPAMTHGSFLIRRSATDPPGLEARFSALPPPMEVRASLNDAWGVTLETAIELEGGAKAVLTPPSSLMVEPVVSEPSGRLRLFVDRNPQARSFEVLATDLIRVAAENAALGIGLEATWDGANSRAEIAPLLFAEISGGTLRLGSEEADGFIANLLASAEVEGRFDIGLEWLLDSGLRVRASGGVEVALPIHRSLGPLDFDTLYLVLGILDDGTLSLEASAALTGKIGPLAATVERIGALLELRIVDGSDSKFGPLDVGLRFKPPNGVGLSVDAGPVKGGGYLYFDFDRQEYAGALELVFSEWIALRAIGLITTKMPDGSKGFSMLIIITVEFGSGIQLGFGFTLLGVGGLLGVHRTVKVEPLKDGIRTGSVESVMFPHDIIANAPRIISDLRAFFPTQKDIFLLGPMAKIGWGTPPLLQVSLGIIVEVPSVNITILGVIKVVLPDEKAAILRLQVNFIGRLEPSNKLLWFYAELYDSRILFITLEGGMGLFVHWGDQANFVVSVGGFHPRYHPPPLPFPAPPRMAVNLLNESYARVRIEGYFAVTSNSVQFGARAEVYFGVSEFKVEGHLGFDALFQFDPFFFSFGLSFSLSVKVFGVGLFSVGFSGLLEGPTPWHIEGKGKISLLFFKISVPFSHTWGKEENTKLDPIEVFPLLEQELAALTNWRAELPVGNHISVSLRKLGEDGADKLVLHPVGTLKISQRKIPLNLKLDRVGNQRPSDADEFSLDVTVGAGGSQSPLQEPFATGQFVDLDDAARLSKPGFAPEDSGVEVAAEGDQRKTSQAVKRVIRYETIVIDSNFKRFVRPFYRFLQAGLAMLHQVLFAHFLVGSPVTNSSLSRHQKKRLRPFDEVISIESNKYSVAFSDDNSSIDEAASFSSHARAVQFMEQKVRVDPALGPRLHVVPNTELKRAA